MNADGEMLIEYLTRASCWSSKPVAEIAALPPNTWISQDAQTEPTLPDSASVTETPVGAGERLIGSGNSVEDHINATSCGKDKWESGKITLIPLCVGQPIGKVVASLSKLVSARA